LLELWSQPFHKQNCEKPREKIAALSERKEALCSQVNKEEKEGVAGLQQ